MRTFIAVPLSSYTKDQLSAYQHDLKSTGADVKWVHPHNFHVTLNFLGDIDGAVVERIASGLDTLFCEFNPFAVEISGLGLFPDPKRPRVIWAEIGRGSEKIECIYEQTSRLLGSLGFPFEKKFVPHITLGRFRSLQKARDLMTALVDFSFVINETITGVSLMESRLRPKGPEYSVLRHFGSSEC